VTRADTGGATTRQPGPTRIDRLPFPTFEVIAEGLQYPEGPTVMPDGSVVVTEIAGGTLARVSTDGEVTRIAEVGGGPNGAAIGPDGALYIANNGGFWRNGERRNGSIQRVDPASGDVRTLYTEDDQGPIVGPNDIVFDRTGNFWFTDFRNDAIFYASPDGSFIRRATTGARSPNGIGLSPDDDRLYWAETFSRQVYGVDIERPGVLADFAGCNVMTTRHDGRTDWDNLLIGMPGAMEFDSLAVQADGAICVATLVDGGITVVNPSGSSAAHYAVPRELGEQVVTNICFGGDDLQTAYVTFTSRGELVRCRWPVPGLRLAFQT
jgi:gluconolactonase